MPSPGRKRVLIVNAYVDDARCPTRRPTTVLKAMGPPFLAGAFRRQLCDVRLYDEASSGPLEDPDLLGWPDMLVLTGMTASFDRMLHLTAYARTKNERVIIVAGGPAIRILHRYAERFFDYTCTGDIEQILEVIEDAFGARYADPEMMPRYDLAYWIRAFGHVESSRNCNFACSFCSLTAEGNRYLTYDVGTLRRQIEACGPRRFLIFIDNNFYGNDRAHFLARLELLREMKRERWFGGWGALVTSDFFGDPENLTLAREAGCQVLFCGIESFDEQSLRHFNKGQNTKFPQVDLIKSCLEAGILLVYGMIADVTTRTVSSLRSELDFVLRSPEITLPTFVVLPIPFPGTPWFHDCVQHQLLLPATQLRDLDGSTLCVRPRDPLPEVAAFVRDLQTLRGHRLRAFTHAAGFLRRYHRSLRVRQLAVAIARDLALSGLPSLVRAGATPLSALVGTRRPRRTHVSTTERLDAVYTPRFPVAARYLDHFRPTPLTDSNGLLAAEYASEADVVGARA